MATASAHNSTTRAGAIGIIPARYGSTRLKAKPLVEIAGRSMLERVWRRAAQASSLERVLIATDDERIARVGRDFAGAEAVVMTAADHPSGSDRVAQAAAGTEAAIIVNIQGDLPLLDPETVDRLVAALQADPAVEIATAAVDIENAEELADPSAVKVTVDGRGRALYFSRSPIPYDRRRPGDFAGALHHLGIYAFRRAALMRFAALEPGKLERKESLEQLRALENGIGISVLVCPRGAALEVDTAAGLESARRAVEASDQGR